MLFSCRCIASTRLDSRFAACARLSSAAAVALKCACGFCYKFCQAASLSGYHRHPAFIRAFLNRSFSNGDVRGPQNLLIDAMTNFKRAIRMGFGYRWTVVGILISSVAVALFWGANLGAVYPIVEVVIKNESLQEWADDRINTAQACIDKLRQELNRRQTANRGEPASEGADAEGVDANDPTGEGTDARDALRALSLHAIESRIVAEQKALTATQHLKPWIDRYLPSDPFQTLLFVIGFLMVGTCLKSLFLIANVVLVERIAQLVAFDLRKFFYRRTLRMEMGCFAQGKTSELTSRFTHDLDGVTVGVRTVFGRALREPFKIIVCLVGAGWICWRLLLFSLIATPLAMVLINGFSKGVKRANRRAMQEMTQVFNRISETFNGIQAVKAFTMERSERARFHNVAKKYAVRAQRIVLYNSLTKTSTEIMSVGVVCVALLAGSYLAINGETHIFGVRMSQRPLTFGSLLAFFALLAGMSDPFRKLSEVYNAVQRGAAAADRIYEYADREPRIVSAATKSELSSPLREVTFERVGFSYDNGMSVLDGVEFSLRAGETVAIVGPNGCGKSSLLNLLPRFYDPISGSIRWNGTDLRDVPIKSLRNRIGLVSQQSMLFDESVADNIRYGSPNATQKEIVSAAERAHAHEFIEQRLSAGYETIVGPEGKRLSGGQRQRIALARAILRDPEVLLLDEATSQVDVESEQLIHKALIEFIRGRTTLMVTHRLASLALADRILVLDSGRIVDIGTHKELALRCEVYQRLHKIHHEPVRVSA